MANMTKTFYKRLIEKYGEKQLVVAIEELSELQKEICKYLRDGKIEKKNIVEEIADVQIMIDQLIVYFDISNSDVENEKKFKLERTRMRLFNDCINE